MNRRVGLVSVSSVLVGLGFVSACASRRPPPPTTAPRPPEAVSISVDNVRVARAAYSTQTASQQLPVPRRGSRRGPTGGLSAEMAQPVLMTANDLVRACYRPFLALSPQAGGTVITLMRVSPDGTVSDVETLGTPDPSLSIMVPCLFSALRSRRFPAVGAPSLVSFPFTFHSGEVQGSQNSPPPEMPRPRPGEVQVMNPETVVARPWRPTLTPNATVAPVHTRAMVDQALPDITSLVDACYGVVLVDRRDFSGSFTLRTVVESSGRVSRVELDPPTFDPLFRQCVVTLGPQLHFHPSVTGANVSIPFTLVVTESESAATAINTSRNAPAGSGPGATVAPLSPPR